MPFDWFGGKFNAAYPPTPTPQTKVVLLFRPEREGTVIIGQ